jgi:hypothetical protein
MYILKNFNCNWNIKVRFLFKAFKNRTTQLKKFRERTLSRQAIIMFKSFIAVIFSALIIFFFVNKENESAESTTKNNKHAINALSPLALKNNKTQPTEQINIEKCLSMEELSKNDYHDKATKWIQDNIVISYEIPSSLQHLSIDDLEQQLGNGDTDILYTLAIKHLKLANSVDILGNNRNKEKNIDQEKIIDLYKKSRKYLWESALHDKHQAFIEIIGSYDIQINSTNNPASIEMYSLERNAYKLLLIELNPDLALFFNIDRNSIKIPDHDSIKTNIIFNEIKNKWLADRQKLGKGKELQLSIPDYMPDYLSKSKNVCATSISN